jgi:hypothetical protein
MRTRRASPDAQRGWAEGAVRVPYQFRARRFSGSCVFIGTSGAHREIAGG